MDLITIFKRPANRALIQFGNSRNSDFGIMLRAPAAGFPRLIQKTSYRAFTSTLAKMSESETPVLFSVQETARIVTLNRPKKLNALNEEMCSSIFNTLTEFSKSDAANLILIKSNNSPRSLCAGGDVASVAQSNLDKNFESSINCFKSEYSLNFQLATYQKPVVVFMDGITMGGGVGLSIHTPFRIATENTKWAMPETDIGFFPDVGTTFALPRLITLANKNAQMALYLCLTGDVISGEDAYLLGLASHYIPHSNLEKLQTRLGELRPALDIKFFSDEFFDSVNLAIEEFTTPLPTNHKFKFSKDQLEVIEKCFDISSGKSINAIFSKLEAFEGTPEMMQFARDTKKKLESKSMTSMQVGIRLMQENSRDDIESALKRDLTTAVNMCVNDSGIAEFSAATKHKLLDKQKVPYPWKQRTELTPQQVTSLIAPKPSLPVSLIRNNSNVTWSQYPHSLKYQLPRDYEIEQQVEKLIKRGPIKKNDVVKYFTDFNPQTKAKLGVEQYCDLLFDWKLSFDHASGLRWKK